jgi:hypothetical protein
MGRKSIPIPEGLEVKTLDAYWESEGAPGHRIQRMVGFWVLWHMFGGQEALEASGRWSRGGIYRQRQEFRETFNCDVDNWETEAVPGLSRMKGYRKVPPL